MADQSNIQSAASKSIRPFRSSEEYLYAMKEDLAEWLNTLYDLDIQVENFMDVLETGFDLCQHANNVNRTALEFQQSHPEVASSMRIPQKEVVFQAKNVVPGSFIARDNISNFIQWCRQELGIQDVLMFETNDLVLKKNEKNFVLCLLEVARKGSKFGMLAPMLIQMEEEIEEEMRDQIAYGAFETSEKASQDLGPESPIYPNRTQRITLCDLKNLDELDQRHVLLIHNPGGLIWLHPTFMERKKESSNVLCIPFRPPRKNKGAPFSVASLVVLPPPLGCPPLHLLSYKFCKEQTTIPLP